MTTTSCSAAGRATVTGMAQRRAHRTSDPDRLAAHLASGLQEITDYAAGIAGEPHMMRIRLLRIEAMVRNMAGECAEHVGAIDEAARFGGRPEWDILGADEFSRTPARKE